MWLLMVHARLVCIMIYLYFLMLIVGKSCYPYGLEVTSAETREAVGLGVQGAKPSWRGLGCPQMFPCLKTFWDCALVRINGECLRNRKSDTKSCIFLQDMRMQKDATSCV